MLCSAVHFLIQELGVRMLRWHCWRKFPSALVLEKFGERMMLGSILRQVELSTITVQVIDGSLELAVDIIKMREGSFW